MSTEIIRNHLKNGEARLARAGARGALQDADEAPEQGALYALLARAQVRLGRADEAMEAAEAAAARLEHWEVRLALAEAMLGLSDAVGARAVLHDALRTVREQAAPDRGDAEVWLGVALARACRAAGAPAAGIDVATDALRWAELGHGARSPEVAEALLNLGVCLHGTHRYEDAHTALHRATRIRARYCPDTPDHAACLDALGSVLRRLGEPFEAVDHHRRALDIWEHTVDPTAAPVGACRHALAQALHRTGEFRAAYAEMCRAVDATEAALGADHVQTWVSRFELARYTVDVGEWDDGLAGMQLARDEIARRLGPGHPTVMAMDRFL